MADTFSMWAVHVVRPLQNRERKHIIRVYRVGAVSLKSAVSLVKADLEDQIGIQDWRVIAAVRTGDISGVVLDGVITKTPSELIEYEKAIKAAGNSVKDPS